MKNSQNNDENTKPVDYKSGLYLLICGFLLIIGVSYYAYTENSANSNSKTTTTSSTAENTARKKAVFYQNNMEFNKETSYSCHLEKKHTCGKEFKVTKATNRLNITVKTITWKNVYDKTNIYVSLFKDSIKGETVAKKSLSMENLIDQGNFTFTLSELNLEPGKYVISFSSDSIDNPIGLAADRNQKEKEYIKDGELVNNSDLKILITQ